MIIKFFNIDLPINLVSFCVMVYRDWKVASVVKFSETTAVWGWVCRVSEWVCTAFGAVAQRCLSGGWDFRLRFVMV